MTQPEREKTSYRVYISVDEKDVLKTFESVVDKLSEDKDMKKFGFQAKTADIGPGDPASKSRMRHQRDRIVLYLGKQGAESALPILQSLAEEKPDVFQKPGVLMAQALEAQDGTKIDGMRITSEVHGISKARSFSELHSNLLEGCLDGIALALKQPKTQQSLSNEQSQLRENLVQIGPKASTREVLGTVLKSEGGTEFLAKQLEENYPRWAGNRGLKSDNLAFRQEPPKLT